MKKKDFAVKGEKYVFAMDFASLYPSSIVMTFGRRGNRELKIKKILKNIEYDRGRD